MSKNLILVLELWGRFHLRQLSTLLLLSAGRGYAILLNEECLYKEFVGALTFDSSREPVAQGTDQMTVLTNIAGQQSFYVNKHCTAIYPHFTG
jgi:hypothetical protein